MYTLIAVVALIALVQETVAVSSGLIAICNARFPGYGCDLEAGGYELGEDGKPDHLKCKDKSRTMHWADKPKVAADVYELFAGPEDAPLKEYVPGQFISISIRVKKFQRQYRGLLLYAQDESGEKVGDWEMVDRVDVFHSACARSVVHTSAEVKPYLTSWRFKVPANQKGKLTFLALIKEGGANRGAFWYPNDLELTPKAGTPAKQDVFRGEMGESCSDVCAKFGGTCDAAGTASLTSTEAIDSQVSPFVVCQPPYLLSCDNVGATTSDDGLCYYSNKAACDAAKITYAAPTCGAKSNADHNGRRLCKCNGAVATTTAAPTTTTTEAPTTTTLPTKPGDPPITTAPVSTCDLYEGTVTCPCRSDANNACDDGLTCRNNKCVRDVCLYAEAGCPCNPGSLSCDAGLQCNEESICVKPAFTQDGTKTDCKHGTVACQCVNGIGCESTDLKCTEGGFCARVARVCDAGAYGCPCVAGTCVTPDLVCFQDGAEDVCTKRLVVDQEDGGAASSLTIALFALLAAFVANF